MVYVGVVMVKVDQSEMQSELADADMTPLHYNITTYSADYTIEVLHQKYVNDDLTIPKFQRKFVWDIKRSSRLIESIMMGLPIPPIFVSTDINNKYLVIDGMQRLKSIFDFISGSFTGGGRTNKKRVFRLQGINSKNSLSLKTYDDFNGPDKRKFKNCVIRTIVVQQRDPKNDFTSIYHIFQRLNTGGMTLLDQEVRNCVYRGKFNELLLQLNEYSSWRKILGKNEPDYRKRDVGYLLRCISLYHDHYNYKKPMRDFLTAFMGTNRNPSPQWLIREECLFKETCDRIVESLGEKPFHPRKALNPSILDSVFAAFARHPDDCLESIKDKFTILRENHAYKKAVSDATTDADVVSRRFKLADSVLFK